jgi:hypothetical protein
MPLQVRRTDTGCTPISLTAHELTLILCTKRTCSINLGRVDATVGTVHYGICRAQPIPSWIQTWDQYALQFYDFSQTPAYKLLNLVASICNIRREASSASPEQLQNSISRAIQLDQEFDT